MQQKIGPPPTKPAGIESEETTNTQAFILAGVPGYLLNRRSKRLQKEQEEERKREEEEEGK